MKRMIPLFTLILVFLSCRENEARWPVEVKGGSFLSQSAERNRRLLQQEEALMERLIAEDSLHTYLASDSGSRYYYLNRRPQEGYLPRPDDLVTLSYEVLSWGNDTIYSRPEIGTLRYKVDKQELFPGLRNSVKLLQAGESAVFLFPSSLAYGYHGDNDRIGQNVPLKVRLDILNIEKQSDSLASNP